MSACSDLSCDSEKESDCVLNLLHELSLLAVLACRIQYYSSQEEKSMRSSMNSLHHGGTKSASARDAFRCSTDTADTSLTQHCNFYFIPVLFYFSLFLFSILIFTVYECRFLWCVSLRLVS